MPTLYFKKYKDTNAGTNWTYDNNCLDVDVNFSNLQIDLPKRKILEYKIYGQGAVIVPTYFFENREISFNYRFKKANNYIFSLEKDEFILNWLYSDDEIYLIKTTERGLQKIKGVFEIKGAEKYKSFTISDNLEINFITESPFWESVAQKKYSSTNGKINFDNEGYLTSFVLEVKNFSAINFLTLRYKTNYFKIYNLFESLNRTFTLDFRFFTFKKDNYFFVPNFAGKTFFLENELNQDLNIETDSDITATLYFNERFF